MKKSARFILVLAATAAFLVGGVLWLASLDDSAATPPPPPPQKPQLVHVPPPNLDDLPKEKRESLERRWERLLEFTAQPGLTPDEAGLTYGNMGMRYHEAGLLASAAACYQNANALQPREFRWLYYLGVVMRELGRYPEALKIFRQAHSLNPEYAPILIVLAEESLQNREFEQARALFQRALDLDDNNTAALLGLGRTAMGEDRKEEGVEYLRRVLELDPKVSAAHTLLANAYDLLGRPNEAAPHRARAGDGLPSIVDPLLLAIRNLDSVFRQVRARAEKAVREGRYPDALNLFREALASEPSNAILHLNIGEIQMVLGQTQAALASFQQALAFSANPDLNLKAHLYLGGLYVKQNQDAQALPHLENALAIQPNHGKTAMQLADLYRRNGRFGDALPLYEMLVGLAPNQAGARFGRLFCLIGARRYADAAAAVKVDITAIPGDASFAHIQARLLAASPAENVRDGAAALAIMDRLSKQYMNSSMAATIAMAAAETGRFEIALNWQRRALQLAGQDKASNPRVLEEDLETYRQGNPCRKPWREDDPIFFQKTYQRPQSG